MPTTNGFQTGEVLTAANTNGYLTKGNRNYIINPDFYINQRGLTSTTGATYGFDRWAQVYNTGTTTMSAVAFALGNAISGYEPFAHVRISTSGQTTSASYAHLYQKIEDVRNLAGQTATISFWAKSNAAGQKIAVELQQFFGTGGSPSSIVFHYAGQASITTSWARYAITTTVPSIAGKTIGTNANTSYLNLNFWLSGGSDYNARSGSLPNQNAQFDIWGVQVEAGGIASPFQVPYYPDELNRCRRYYQLWQYADTQEVAGQLGYAPSNYYYFAKDLPIRMRVAPSFSALTPNYWRRPSDASLQTATVAYLNPTSDGYYAAFAAASGGYHSLSFFLSISISSAEF